MPPKPWERNRNPQQSANSESLSREIEQNNVETSKVAEEAIMTDGVNPDPTGATSATGLNNNSTMNNSRYGGGNSMYGGGYGGSSMYGGGYGSSMYGGGMGGGMYGGMGGMGGMYGGMGGMGGMYGGGMYGNQMMGGDPNNPGFLQNSMQYLHSLGYVLMSLTEIARNLEMNAEGLGRFWHSLYNLGVRIKGWGSSLIQKILNLFITAYLWVKKKILNKVELLTGTQQSNLHYQKKLLTVTIRVMGVLLIASLFPVMRGMLNSNEDDLFENSLKE